VSLAISVIASGMVTAVGNSSAANGAAMRAGIRNVVEGKLWDYGSGELLTVGRPQLRQWWIGRSMLAELVAPAIEECFSVARAIGRARVEDIPIVLVVAPNHRPSRWPDLDREAMSDLALKLGRPLAPGSILLAKGRSGIVPALEHAAALLEARQVPLCVVAGVESFLKKEIADYYQFDEIRLLSSENSNGFSLGEAGAAVLVSLPSWHQHPELVIHGMGQANDPSKAGGTQTHAVKGEGLIKAIRQALAAAGVSHHDIELRISDANGEQWKFKEATFAAARLDRMRPAHMPPRRLGYIDHWHPSEFIGEVGAAIGPIMLGFALHAGQKRYLPGARVLFHAAEDDGDRAAILAEFRSNGRKGH
jgi:3-oxoacyl-[acyl-carrier-protein] synthase I